MYFRASGVTAPGAFLFIFTAFSTLLTFLLAVSKTPGEVIQ